MTIEPITTGGYLLTCNFNGRMFVTECETPALCWAVARGWMSDVVGEGVL